MKRWTLNLLALAVVALGATRLAAEEPPNNYIACMEYCVVEFGLSFEYCHGECRQVADES